MHLLLFYVTHLFRIFRILAAVKSARVKGSVEQYPLETDPSSASVIPDMLENIVKLVNSNFFQINLKF